MSPLLTRVSNTQGVNSLSGFRRAFLGRPSGAGAGGYSIARSLRFNSSSTDYLSKTPTASNRRTWTWSGWVKRTAFGATHALFHCRGTVGNNATDTGIGFTSDDNLRFVTGATNAFISSGVYRDPSAWYHVCYAFDTTQTTPADRIRVYVNGEQLTASSASYPTQNSEWYINSAAEHAIGRHGAIVHYLDGYLADVHFIDGLALPPSAFGETDAYGVWQPKQYINPNNGTTWSNYVTGNSLYAYGPTRAFDGNLSTQAIPDRTGTSTPSTLTFTPPSDISGKVGIYFLANTNEDDSATISINGTDVSSTLRAVQAAGGSQPWYYEFDSITSLSSIAWTAETGYDGWNVYGITIDGKLLVDGATAYGTNGFNLLFDDASSASALGTDSTSNGNNWTVSSNINPYGTKPAPTWYISPTLYTTKSDIISNGTVVANGGSVAIGNYIYILPSGNETSGDRVYSPGTGALDNNHKYWHWNGINWLQTGGGYNNTDFSAFQWGANHNNTYTLQSDRDFYVLSNYDTSPAENSGTLPSFLSNNPDCDSLFDSPTNGTQTDSGLGGELSGNYCTMSPLVNRTTHAATFKNGNLEVTFADPAVYQVSYGTMAVTSGKWYFEVAAGTFAGNTELAIGVSTPNPPQNSSDLSDRRRVYKENGDKRNDTAGTAYGATFSSNDVIGCAFDLVNGTITFYKNGTLQGTAFTDLLTAMETEGWTPYVYGFNVTFNINFGQRPFANSSVPAGYKALCTSNLPNPTIADPSTLFDTFTYQGNGTGQTRTDLSFQPDMVWIKATGNTYWHHLYDAVRGAEQAIFPNDPYIEVNKPNALTAFTTNGFTVGTDTDVNSNTRPYVAWCWDGGTSFTNSASANGATVASTGYSNPDSGFAIVSYTGNASNQSNRIYHGLGTEPSMIIYKNRSDSENWIVYFKDVIPLNEVMHLDLPNAISTASYSIGTYSNYFGDPNGFTSNTFSITAGSSYINRVTANHIAYVFSPRENFSAFGTFVGNSSADGPFVYTGFKPKFLMVKWTTASEWWWMFDTARDTYNASGFYLGANEINQQSDLRGTYPIDILSNGFKVRNATYPNGSQTALYMAFAEHPFKTARAR